MPVIDVEQMQRLAHEAKKNEHFQRVLAEKLAPILEEARKKVEEELKLELIQILPPLLSSMLMCVQYHSEPGKLTFTFYPAL